MVQSLRFQGFRRGPPTLDSHTATRSKIFVRNATVLDCAVLDPVCGPRGRSWYVDVQWRGSLDDERVVFDFAHAKKNAKAVVDELFDHRLLAPQSLVTECGPRLVLRSPFLLPEHESSTGEASRVAGRFLLDTYPTAIYVLPDEVVMAALAGDLVPLSFVIADAIKKRAPGNVDEVRVTLRGHELNASPHHFSYTHSLRQHAGNCQRFHGHANVVEVFDAQGRLDAEASCRAARLLDGRYLVSPHYVEALPSPSTRLEESSVSIRYHGSQGEVRAVVPRAALLLLPDESSIENISLFLHKELGLPPDWEVHAYEGLAKGAVAPA